MFLGEARGDSSRESIVDQVRMLAALWPLFLVFGGLVVFAWIKIIVSRWIRSITPLGELDSVEAMSGEDFERWLRGLFERQGWKVSLTPEVGDYGADLLLEKEGSRIAVQAKRWKRQVGIKAVQEAVAARDYYRTNSAWVVTNSTFTQAAMRQAKASGIVLMDKGWLVAALTEERKKKRLEDIRA